MAVNYNDERFQQVDREKEAALNEVNQTYNTMINNSDAYYQSMQNAVNDYANKQNEIQQANTDFTIEQINQQKDWLKKDYEKEQKGAYVDWRKQSNQYGVNAEQMASAGLSNTGYSESSQVSMYNTYQNRVATAREAYLKGVQNYDNGIKEAQLTNNAKLAEIAANALQKNLQLALEGFQYKNSLLQSQLSAKQGTEDRYYNRWQNVLSQINTENALAEQQRQFNASLKASSRSSGGGSGSKSGSINKNSATGLSANAQKMLKDYFNVKSSNADDLIANVVKKADKNTIGNVINTLYQKNLITPNDVYILADKFGL